MRKPGLDLTTHSSGYGKTIHGCGRPAKRFTNICQTHFLAVYRSCSGKPLKSDSRSIRCSDPLASGTMDSAEESAREEARWVAMGQHLRALREGRRWLQETLAKKADVSVATIRAVENHSPGRHQTPRTLEKLSRALQQPGDYLRLYLENAPLEDSSGGAEASATPSQSPLDLVVPRLDEIVVARLHEIVVPRLENVEGQVRALRDAIRHTERPAEVDVKRPGDAE